MAEPSFKGFAEIVDAIQHARTGTGFIAMIDIYPIVALDRMPSERGLRACATEVYRAWDKTSVVAGVTPSKVRRWRTALIEHVSENPFNYLSEVQCAQAARLGGRLAELIETEMGAIRMVATVDYRPHDWYAAQWEDWLLVAAGRATVLHLGWDS
ncbi:hypothetical protein OIE68_11795 [Nocardia vinacea]|uniref:Uncharacterized protein n=1 Tax=Nocardia vinacea TaxID=96468 RepID=A0ABZ1YW88_9NOCA|nr:hypothetical protein OIE68_11795 [Nocardia vinacea]